MNRIRRIKQINTKPAQVKVSTPVAKPKAVVKQVISKPASGAYQESDTYKRRVIEKATNFPVAILIHHTGGTDADPLADTSHHTAKIIEQWHIQKGWNGLGYQYVIEKSGLIVKGRPEHVEGAHEPDMNKESIGICLSGNFDATLPTKEQTESLKILLKDICSRLPIKTIDPHRKYANKTCYGRRLSDTWAYELYPLV